MNVATVRAHLDLISVRHYVYLLVTVILALASFLIGYLYWQNHAYAEVEDIANHYHLETVLYATQIKEEVQRMLAQHAEDEARGHASTEHAWSEGHSAPHLYVIKKDLIEITGLHDNFPHASQNQERYTPVLRKAQRQLDGIDKLWREAGITSGAGRLAGTAQELRLFAYSIEQLKRLHVTAREELQTQQSMERGQAVRNVVVVFVVVVALGSLIVRKILSQISRLIARRERSEVGLREEIEQRTLAQAKLRESEQRLRTLASLAPVGICRSDMTGACIYVNERCLELFGLPGRECLGHEWIESLHEEDRERIRERWAAAVAEGQGLREECRSKRADGQLVHQCIISPKTVDSEQRFRYSTFG